MKDFNERKKEYLNKLRENPSILDKFTDKITVDKGETLVLMEMLLNPNNDEELKIADMIVTLFIDIFDLKERSLAGDVKKIPLEENAGINYYVDIINKLKSKKEINPLETINPENTAEIIYGFITSIFSNLNETICYIAEKVGFNLEDKIESKLFELYIDKAKSLFKESNRFASPINEKVDIEDSFAFCKKFHELCEEGKLIKSTGETLILK